MGAAAPRHPVLRLIAVYKFCKALGLLLLGMAAFGFVHTPLLQSVANEVAALPIRSGHAIIAHWMDELLDLQPRNFAIVGGVACAYAALFATEGIGLWLGKGWAEWLTVFATASLIPFELWELAHHVTALKFLALAVNVAIVIYLWHLARRDH